MKSIYKYPLFLLVAMAVTGIFAGCDDDDAAESGQPSVSYVRVIDPVSSDSLLSSAFFGQRIVLVGKNLGGVQQAWFNDQRASLNPAFITNTNVFTTVPLDAPVTVTNQIKLVFANGKEIFHDFIVAVPRPEVLSMKSEYVDDGDVAIIRGDYFYEPIAVGFPGGGAAEILEVTQKELKVRVPAGSTTGQIAVQTNFGLTISSFHFRDQRNIILNYDNLTANGSWRPGPTGNTDPLQGNYLRLFGTLNANARAEDNFESQFWGHTRPGSPTNIVPVAVPLENFALKFEARVVNWYGSVFQICWGPHNNANNQEVWSNLNARGIWAPWQELDKNYTTNGEWITVEIPLNQMIYRHEQQGGQNVWLPNMTLDPLVTGTLSFWVIGTAKANASPVDLHIDNVRLVER